MVWKRCLAEIRVYDIINSAPPPGLRRKPNRSGAGKKNAPPPDFAGGRRSDSQVRLQEVFLLPLPRGVEEVQDATGKTANANRKIVNAARAPSPKRAQMYLATGSSCKWKSRTLAIKPFKTIKTVNKNLIIFMLLKLI